MTTSTSRRGNASHGIDELRKANNDLRRELEEIRSSKEDELLRAYAYIEQLNDEKDDLSTGIQALTDELLYARKREDRLVNQLAGGTEDGTVTLGNSCSDLSSLSCHSLGKDTVLDDILQRYSQRTLLEQKQEKEKEFDDRVKTLEQKNEEQMKIWKSKVEYRDKVIEGLNKIAVTQIKKLRRRLHRQSAKAKVSEDLLQQKLDESMKIVEEKTKVIAKKGEKIKRYRNYIEELTSQLENLAKERGLLADRSLKKSSTRSLTSTSISSRSAGVVTN